MLISDCPFILPSYSHPIFTLSLESLYADPIMLASLTMLETQQLHIFRGHGLYYEFGDALERPLAWCDSKGNCVLCMFLE